MSGMAAAFFLYGYSAFVARDVVSTVVLPLFWIMLFALCCHWFMTRPYRVLVLPVIAIAVWFFAMLA